MRMGEVVSYYDGTFESGETEVVREFPLKLVVNHREIATLVCSPHDLRFLAVGFLRLQGFVNTADDLLRLEVCDRTGVALVSIRGEVPEKLKPVLTSGGGAGISFSVGNPGKEVSALGGSSRRVYLPSEIFGMMEQLARLAVKYTNHGGTHSTAVGDGGSVLLHAEDLGRHNTLDRIAGEALLRGIDLSGMMLVTSGRVPTEMAAKAARLGISLIASRTTPTDRAVALCRDVGIALVGYVRVGRFAIYACPERVASPDRSGVPVPAGL
jgi:FdhD protein